MNKSTFQAGMAILQAAYPGFIDDRTSRVTLDVYWKFLNDIPDEAFEVGVKNIVREQKHFPSISEILEASTFDYKEAAALDSWAEITKLISGVGSWRTPIFSHPQAAPALESIGGWKMLCLTPTDKMGYHRDAFLRAFKILLNRNNQLKLLSEAKRTRLLSGKQRG